MAPAAAALHVLCLGLCCYLSVPSVRSVRKQSKHIQNNHRFASVDCSLGEKIRNRISSWYDLSGGGGSKVPSELTHRAFADPLPDVGDEGRTAADAGAHSDISTEFTQPSNPVRLVRYAPLAFPHHLPTKNRASKALKAGNLLLNSTPNVEGCRNLHRGDVLTLLTHPPPRPSVDEISKRINFVRHLLGNGLSVAYEDDDLAAVYKPAGIHTKRDTNYRYLSLEDALPAVLTPPSVDSVLDALPLPLAVHRLDVRVCGLVLVAKTKGAMLNLGEQFERREVKKRYKALVVGRPGVTLVQPFNMDEDEDVILIDAPIKVEGRGTLPARTTLKVLSTTPHAHWGALSYVELRPETGRTHQLRVHCAGIGCPIVGDDLYWDYAVQARRDAENGETPELPPVKRGGGMYLQSISATFSHPATGEVMFLEVSLVEKFGRLREKAKRASEYDDSGLGGDSIAPAAAA